MAHNLIAGSPAPSRAELLGQACRHYIPLGTTCRIGHPIKKIVTAANGNIGFGIAFMLPCRPGPERKAECPDYDPKTPEELAADKAALREKMDKFVSAWPVLNAVRATMVAGKIARQIVDCPFCNQPRALHVTCAIGVNYHLSAICAECGMRFLE